MECEGCNRRREKLRRLGFRLGMTARILREERTSPAAAYRTVVEMEKAAAKAWDEAVARAAEAEEATWA